MSVPSTGRERLVTFPTARRTVGHLREASATSMVLKPVCALQAGKVSLLVDIQNFGDAFSMHGTGSLIGSMWECAA